MNLRTIDNPSTSRECFNSSNLYMPPTMLIYSSDQLVSSLCRWLCTNDHDSSPIPNNATIVRKPQLPSALTSIMFSIESWMHGWNWSNIGIFHLCIDSSDDYALRFTEELLFCTECNASTYFRLDGSHFVDFCCLVNDSFGAPLVFTFSRGGHMEFISG